MKLSTVAAHAKGEDPAENAYAVIHAATREPVPAVSDDDRPAGSSAEQVKVPDLAGLPMRAAIRAAVETGLQPVVNGSGRLLRTEPVASTRVPKGSKLILVFEPQT